MTEAASQLRPATTGPLVLGAPTLALRAVPARTLHRARAIGALDPLADLAIVGTDRAVAGRPWRAVPDGNRAAVIADPSLSVELWGRRWAVGIKGVGAGAPLYGDGPLAGIDGRPVRRPIVRESWMGESPFGAQGEPNARAAIARTDEAVMGQLHGLPICPVLSVVEIPEALVEPGHHYRRFEGPIVQEHRLVPSNLRLFHGSGPGLGQAAARFVVELGLDDRDALFAFVEQLLGSGLSALTLFARSLRATPDGALEGLDLDDAWLDKDAVVAPDGRLHFVDLESLDWTKVPDAAAARARIARQLDRNAYDLLFAVDALLRAGEETSDELRRRRIATLARLALDADTGPTPLHVDETPSGTHLVLRPALLGEIVLRFLSPSPR